MRVEKTQDCEKTNEDPLSLGIVIFPENGAESRLIEFLLEQDYYKEILEKWAKKQF